MLEDLFNGDWTKGLIVLRSRVEMITKDRDGLMNDISRLKRELKVVDRMLMAIPYENTRVIYEKIVSRKIGDLYDLARNPGIVK